MEKFLERVDSVKDELRKVTWPKWQEIKSSTLLVIVFSIFVALFLSAFGVIFNKLIEFIK
ncbi:MAG: preprotein translocase subunit SecE [Fusobacteria bacterium]|jgi:preprotein translocase subunit SecE|nr:preprotein translocase subunit SecE [Fusobacteriota bacterium]